MPTLQGFVIDERRIVAPTGEVWEREEVEAVSSRLWPCFVSFAEHMNTIPTAIGRLRFLRVWLLSGKNSDFDALVTQIDADIDAALAEAEAGKEGEHR